ncbi:MAG: succinylglutamate desuccinylase/aspartoacylase family protein [Rickettsiales bacterium]|nr:succinylglutamate desuccinylase/aspartoacylase family protein [Rickettsiales bacterium]
MIKKSEFIIDNIEIKHGERKRINIDVGAIYDFTDVKIPLEVVRGKKDGPTLFISSTIHGDEINGIEIVKRVLKSPAIKNICGTLIAIPIVNIFGFNDRSRYLPDRRDLNRCFPGLKNGSMTSQIAYKFMNEVVMKSDYGIDLHTGAFHRDNYPQIRANLNDFTTLNLAKAFGAPVIINSNLRDGSLREAVSRRNIPMLLYEGGEALRFDETVIKIGVAGILNFMREIGMIESEVCEVFKKKTFIANSSYWVRASRSGIHTPRQKLGTIVKKGEILGEISNPFGDHKCLVRANAGGVIIGTSKLPMTNQGDALFHIATRQNIDDEAMTSFEVIENNDPVNR